MTQASDLQGMSIMLGEIKGQLRELIHTVNNTVMKLDALTREVIETKGIPADLAALEVRVSENERRITKLEADLNRREGAVGVWRWLVSNWPSLLLLAAAIIAIAKFKLISL